MNEKSTFWADSIAKEITERKRYRYLNKEIEQPKIFIVKSSASISGVLHIGRLSDTIRGEVVVKSLKDLNYNAKLIWVAEDMDPLRKIPSGVPESYKEYIGMPVSDVPDPWGCHKTYAEHHKEEYFKVLHEFLMFDVEKYSMREEYKKGNFNKFIKLLLEKIELLKKIQNKYRKNPLPEGWSPFIPICENCGKIITPRVIEIENGKIHYICKDYSFEKYTAKGCNYEGFADPMKGNGKLMWKSEWAAQWVRWNVCAEGAGKEYQVPGSAFWINAEIVEKIFDYPSPVPIFYEHLLIDDQKMSASIGNVVYPKQWLEVARPEVLRYIYCKKIMKTRSFSWKNLPLIYDEFDECAKVYHGIKKGGNEKEEKHLKRLYEMSQTKGILPYIPVSYSYSSLIGQIFKDEKEIINSLRRTGHWKEELKKYILERVKHATTWAKKYAPEEYKIKINDQVDKKVIEKLSEKCKNTLKELGEELVNLKEENEEKIKELFQEIIKKHEINAREFFQGFYLSIMNKERGPRASTLIISLTPQRVGKILLTIDAKRNS